MTTQIKPKNIVVNCLMQAKGDSDAPEPIIHFHDDATSTLALNGYAVVPLETLAQFPYHLQDLAVKLLREIAEHPERADNEQFRVDEDKPTLLAYNIFLSPNWNPQQKGPKQ